jgi:hypothetical protein
MRWEGGWRRDEGGRLRACAYEGGRRLAAG